MRIAEPIPTRAASLALPVERSIAATAAVVAAPGVMPLLQAPQASVPPGAIVDADAWHHMVATSGLKGPARLLAEHAGFAGYANGVLSLSLPDTDAHLRGATMVRMVADALAPALGLVPQIRFEAATQPGQSLRERDQSVRDQRQASAEATFKNDPDVQRLMSQHGARIVPDSIRPFDE